MKLAISVIESAFRLHSDSVIFLAVSVMIFVNFGSTNNLFPVILAYFVFTLPAMMDVCEVSDILTFTFSDRLRTPQNASIFCG